MPIATFAVTQSMSPAAIVVEPPLDRGHRGAARLQLDVFDRVAVGEPLRTRWIDGPFRRASGLGDHGVEQCHRRHFVVVADEVDVRKRVARAVRDRTDK
jgi:hypothetical protein